MAHAVDGVLVLGLQDALGGRIVGLATHKIVPQIDARHGLGEHWALSQTVYTTCLFSSS